MTAGELDAHIDGVITILLRDPRPSTQEAARLLDELRPRPKAAPRPRPAIDQPRLPLEELTA